MTRYAAFAFPLLLATFAVPAFASEPICPYVEPAKWMEMTEAEEIGRSLGLDLAYVQADAGCWTAYGNKEGWRYEIYLHPETGEVVRTKQYSINQ